MNSTAFTVTLPAVPESVVRVERMTDSVTEKMGFDGLARDEIAISVTEAVNNAIEHGVGEGGQEVTVRFQLFPAQLVIKVMDRGEGFDPSSLEDPLAPENILRERGRGLLIIRSLMDEVEINVREGGGTEVCMTKFLRKS